MIDVLFKGDIMNSYIEKARDIRKQSWVGFFFFLVLGVVLFLIRLFISGVTSEVLLNIFYIIIGLSLFNLIRVVKSTGVIHNFENRMPYHIIMPAKVLIKQGDNKYIEFTNFLNIKSSIFNYYYIVSYVANFVLLLVLGLLMSGWWLGSVLTVIAWVYLGITIFSYLFSFLIYIKKRDEFIPLENKLYREYRRTGDWDFLKDYFEDETYFGEDEYEDEEDDGEYLTLEETYEELSRVKDFDIARGYGEVIISQFFGSIAVWIAEEGYRERMNYGVRDLRPEPLFVLYLMFSYVATPQDGYLPDVDYHRMLVDWNRRESEIQFLQKYENLALPLIMALKGVDKELSFIFGKQFSGVSDKDFYKTLAAGVGFKI